MYIVALTGGIGCGKSEATKIFAEFGVPIVDLDIISHQLTAAKQPLVVEIARQFGTAFTTPEGALNRATMRKLIFSDENARKKLNAILHPAIQDAAMRQLNSHSQAYYQILAIPLLFEDSQYRPHINRVLVIDCDEKIQIERVKARSQLSETEVLQIIRAQGTRQDILNLADDVVDNNGNVAELRTKIEALHQKYINTCIVSKTIS
ncbi:MAG: dephospho-CoA kinase [Methylophilaceae bacterium]